MIKTSRMTLALMLALSTSAAWADGEKTYEAVCSACHATGVAGAPKVGDRKVWSPLIKEGQATLTAHGYVGVRAMPPKGGKPDLSVEDFAAALKRTTLRTRNSGRMRRSAFSFMKAVSWASVGGAGGSTAGGPTAKADTSRASCAKTTARAP
jgi:cytochrome c5